MQDNKFIIMFAILQRTAFVRGYLSKVSFYIIEPGFYYELLAKGAFNPQTECLRRRMFI